MSQPLCTACIPAFQAEAFIARTLDCAQGQTEREIKIHVSVDHGDDATADICESRARSDPRILVWRQSERLGWDVNANFLINRVETPYFFFYFHDDLIEPAYVKRLCALLQNRPDAASAHGDLKHFGATDHVAQGAAFDGAPFERLFQFLDPRHQPPLLRSMTRTATAQRAELFMPMSRGGGIGANHVYSLGLLSCGPALHAPEVLYHRCNMRNGGLTESWRGLSIGEVRTALQDNANAVLRLRVGDGSRELELMRLLAFLLVMTRMRLSELERDILAPTAPITVSPHFADLSPGLILASVEPGVQERALPAYGRLLYLEADQCERRRDFDGALAGFLASAIADAGSGPALGRIPNVRRKALKGPRVLEDAIEQGCTTLSAGKRVQLLRIQEVA